jgi:hypothetical protein
MALDLNTVPGEESEQPLITSRSIPSTMAIDLNEVPGERSEEPLPDLNQEPDDDVGDEIHYLQEDQFHLVKEAQVHPLKGQSHYLHKEHHGGARAIDLNIPACEGQEEECHDGNVYLTSISKESNFSM